MKVSFYCINFNDDARRSKMIQRFSIHNINLEFVNPVYTTDKRLNVGSGSSGAGKDITPHKRTWSIMLQHLDSIQHFVENTENDYLFLCEDDILISKNMTKDLPNIIYNFEELKLDVLLLGYLMHFKLDKNHPHAEFPVIKDASDADDAPYTYYGFPYHLWGSQMYLISRKHAVFLLNKYDINYALADLNRPYNPDWTLTKDGARAMIYPMVALEEGATKTDHTGQNSFHKLCFDTNYDEQIFF
jgi:hypothetical protein